MKILSIFISILFCFQTIYSQQTCDVSIASLQGKYTGDCKNNKANGIGKAEGIDTYSGSFKNGYPSGEGTYTFKNGDYFIGNFNKGIKDGKGEYHFKRTNTEDSVVKGFWKNDSYNGLYEKDYEILNKTSGFTRMDVKNVKVDVKTNAKSKYTLTIFSQNAIKNAQASTGIIPPVPVISFYNTSKGSYETDERSSTDNSSTLILYGIKFPLQIRIQYPTENFEILINKEGSWEIKTQYSL